MDKLSQDPWGAVDTTIKDVNTVRSLMTGNVTSLSDAKEKVARLQDVKEHAGAVAGVVAASGVLKHVDVDALEKELVGTNAFGFAKQFKQEQAKDKSENNQTSDDEAKEADVGKGSHAYIETEVAVSSDTADVNSGFENDEGLNAYTEDNYNDYSDREIQNVDSFYQANNATYDDDDDLLNKIRMQTADLNINNGNESEGLYQDSGNFIHSSSIFEDEFNFNKLLKNQYLIFSDYDISDILDFIFKLNSKHAHKVTYPAAVIYQCVRYADHIKENEVLVETFLNLTFTKIRSNITSSMTGITNVLKDGDIVLQSYWVSVINFLFYYLCKDEGFFIRYPKVLQELIITLNSLILELTNCLKFRMGLIIDDCLLNYTNIPDLSEAVYKSDWNFFKKKQVKHSTFDDIYQMLYPPSVKQQLKPSPIKIIQTLGALLYVLDIHQVHPLIKQQCFSIVFQWLSFTIFNRIITNKKHLSRKKAIQIRLNLSSLEDWARSNDQAPKMPDIDLEMYKKFPYNLTEGDHAIIGDFTPRFAIHNCLFYRGDATSPADLQFYHGKLFDIFRYFFEPLYQLMQYLQCLTGLKEEDELMSLLPHLTKLNHLQLLQVLNKYRYEVDEEKVPKGIKAKITAMTKTEDQTIKKIPYLDKNMVHLNPDYVYPVALVTLSELIDQYGSGIGGVNRERAIQFQPFLPYDIIDAIDEIHEQTTEKINNQRYGDDNDEEYDDGEEENDYNNDTYEEDKNKDDGLFKELQMPRSLVHKTWGEDENEINPW